MQDSELLRGNDKVSEEYFKDFMKGVRAGSISATELYRQMHLSPEFAIKLAFFIAGKLNK